MTVVVGRVFRHGDFSGLDREQPPEVYRPHAQRARGNMSLVIRTTQEPAALAAAVRAEIRKMDPDLPIPAVRTMREIISQTVAERRFQMALTVLFGVAAGLFAAVIIGRALRGLLYGITSTDPVSLGLVALALLVTAGLACYLPARRAAKLDPMIALRHE